MPQQPPADRYEILNAKPAAAVDPDAPYQPPITDPGFDASHPISKSDRAVFEKNGIVINEKGPAVPGYPKPQELSEEQKRLLGLTDKPEPIDKGFNGGDKTPITNRQAKAFQEHMAKKLKGPTGQ